MSRHRSFATAIAVLLLASPLAAQSFTRHRGGERRQAAPVVTRSTPDPLALLSPTWAPAWTNVDGARAFDRAHAGSLDHAPQKSESGAMMVVGGAALLVGAIVGGKAGTAMMVGGGVFGLIGLWTYLR